ncbi:MAG: hypothetical protein A3J93_03310 [Candidatus Magasanikbacteria bacterium RIFOXYC2_FULL_42_28]|uniref:Dipeptidylpeptidase IV N-terminal domain-containing protein n=1 Tax=Candidatus Magasanikbacteria bacterium RIFOXYC2_FULL_42_28 TaxID=1798704 RepID=A0A1F6NUP0_9BACT|nr:MAG: hypothetical protein A3J93_03310 [Candidatus Magasanikbacteria bacterium RIFOXYC2_FULL_42_28]
MSPTLKRALLIAGLIIVVALIGFGLYKMFQKTTGIGTTRPGVTPTEPGQLPTAGERPVTGTVATSPGTLPAGQTVTLPPQTLPPSYYQPKPVQTIVDNYASYASLDKNGSLRYYDAGEGKFYRVLPNGEIKELSGQVFYNVQNVTWAPSNNKAILEYPDGNKTLYNFEMQKQYAVPQHWDDFTFSPDSRQYGAKSLGLSPENRWLVISNDDGTGSKLIAALGENEKKVTMNWSPSRQVIAFSQTGEPLGAERHEVLFLGLNNENFKSTIVEGNDFRPNWSPTGKKLLYSVYSARTDYKPELWLVDSYGDQIGDNRQMLKLNTWADKCAFADDTTLFCAVPRSLPQGAGILPEVASGIYDDVYKIDVKTGLNTSIPMGGDYQINSIFYDQSQNRVIFTADNSSGVFEAQL